MRMTKEELARIAARPGYAVREGERRVGERGPDRQKRKEGSGRAKTYPDYNRMLLAQIELAGLPAGTPEFVFHPVRKWRLDVAYPDRKLAVEVDGAVHRIKGMFFRDIDKHQALFFEGWRLLRVTTAQVRNGEAVRLVERALALLPAGSE